MLTRTLFPRHIFINKCHGHFRWISSSCFFFPGQGTQYVGMCKRLLTQRKVLQLFEDASKILGHDLLSLCLNGPVEELNKTVNCQPAIVVASLAALQDEKVKGAKVLDWSDNLDVHMVVTAGFSVGELSALIFSEALSFEDGLKVVKVRAEAMQEASDQVPSGLVSIMGHADLNIELLCDNAEEWSYCRGTQEPVACVANYLFPGGWVLGGDKSSVQYILKYGKAKHGIKRAQLIPVSGAFHTKLMEPAQEPLRRVLESVNIQTPRCTVYSGTSCQPITSPDQIKKLPMTECISAHIKHEIKNKETNNAYESLLVRQLVEPVNWSKTIQNISKGRTRNNKLYEVGPGKQLRAMIYRIDRTLLDNFTNLEP